jgi:hypothetical protein
MGTCGWGRVTVSVSVTLEQEEKGKFGSGKKRDGGKAHVVYGVAAASCTVAVEITVVAPPGTVEVARIVEVTV